MEWLARTRTMFTALFSKTITSGFAGDGREEALLKYVLENAERNPESVLKTIDQYAKKSWLMNIGEEKGGILLATITMGKPKVLLELGAYVGYSATLIGSNMKDGANLISLEMNLQNADITRQVVNHAGLSDKVQVVQGILKDRIEEIKKLLQSQNATAFDLVFIDHDKECYLSDVLILKDHGLIGKGTILFADNMKIPGSPVYREYMRQHPDEYDTVEHKTRFEYAGWLPDSILISTCK